MLLLKHDDDDDDDDDDDVSDDDDDFLLQCWSWLCTCACAETCCFLFQKLLKTFKNYNFF